MARNLVLGTVLAVLIAGPAVAGCEGSAQWLWSANSDVINRSTQALAAGRASQAKSLAESALAHRLSPTDTRIASLNLCLLSVAGGASATTDANCQTARTGAENAALLCGETVSKARKVSGADVSAAIAGNIAAAGTRGTLAQSSPTR
jgi:hypothetical protein